MDLENAKIPVETLRAWIREHKIWWEVLPVSEIHDRKLLQVGFEFHLYGRHPRSGTGPGCSECHALHDRLRLLASSVLPEDVRASRYDVDPYHAAFYCGQEPATFDVRLTLRIRHREGYFDPIDACEIRCSKEIQENL
jgi:hypothetical protein